MVPLALGLRGVGNQIHQLDHVRIATVSSPSGSARAIVELRGEGFDPPYGESVTLVSWWMPLPDYFGADVFAGGCRTTPRVAWDGDNTLIIQCNQDDRASRQESQWGSVSIRSVGLQDS
jgi:hypothetical protein